MNDRVPGMKRLQEFGPIKRARIIMSFITGMLCLVGAIVYWRWEPVTIAVVVLVAGFALLRGFDI